MPSRDKQDKSAPCANSASTPLIMLVGEEQEALDEFTYLGSIVNQQGGTDVEVRVRNGKTEVAYLKKTKQTNICNTKYLTIPTKIRIFNTNAKSFRLHCA